MEEGLNTRSLELVRRLLDKLEDRLETTDLKGTAADFIRLLQLEQELRRDEIREVRVQWINNED